MAGIEGHASSIDSISLSPVTDEVQLGAVHEVIIILRSERLHISQDLRPVRWLLLRYHLMPICWQSLSYFPLWIYLQYSKLLVVTSTGLVLINENLSLRLDCQLLRVPIGIAHLINVNLFNSLHIANKMFCSPRSSNLPPYASSHRQCQWHLNDRLVNSWSPSEYIERSQKQGNNIKVSCLLDTLPSLLNLTCLRTWLASHLTAVKATLILGVNSLIILISWLHWAGICQFK